MSEGEAAARQVGKHVAAIGRGVVHLDDIGEDGPVAHLGHLDGNGLTGNRPPDEHHQAFDTRKGAPALDHSLDGDAVMCPRVHGLTPSPSPVAT